MIPSAIRHVFVLMLENRSFDHLLAYTLTPDDLPPVTDAAGATTPLKNTLPAAVRPDPPHEADDVFWQLTGAAPAKGATYAAASITNAGFAARYDAFLSANPAFLDQPGQAPQSVRDQPISGYRPNEVPIIAALAGQFQACTRWHSSLPGPTWPNRFFAHAGTSGGFYCSPSDWTSLSSTLIKGFAFRRGTLFDQLDRAGVPWRVYHGDALPQVLALKGFNPARLAIGGRMAGFGKDNDLGLAGDYAYAYTFIEPDYGHDLRGDANTLFGGGNSQHPVGSIADGEQLIADVYRQIGDAGLWASSLLLVTYDEHGGFTDRCTDLAIAGFTPALNDDASQAGLNDANVAFDFSLHGVRVPAIAVSPWLPPGTCDGVFDHCTIARTLRDVFPALGRLPASRFSNRVNAARSLAELPWLAAPRAMPPLPAVNRAFQQAAAPRPTTFAVMRGAPRPTAAERRSLERLDSRHLGALALAARARAELSPRKPSPAALARELSAIDTVTKAKLYLADTKALIDRHRIAAHAKASGLAATSADWTPTVRAAKARRATKPRRTAKRTHRAATKPRRTRRR